MRRAAPSSPDSRSAIPRPMRDGRTTGIPTSHIVAELAAFPLASQESFELAPNMIDPNLEGASGALWRAAEHHVLSSFPGLSVDSALAMRDGIWFGFRGPRPVVCRLDEYLLGVRAAGRTFTSLVDRIVEQSRTDGVHDRPLTGVAFTESVDRTRWRWLVRALPPDLLGLAPPVHGHPPRPERISAQLARQLADNGYAEVHLHLGAALEFDGLWIGLLRALRKASTGAGALESPGAPFSEGALLAPWLLRGAIGRLVLAGFLAARGKGGLKAFVERAVFGTIRRVLGITDAILLLRTLEELRTGRLASASATAHARVRDLYAQLGGSHDVRRRACTYAELSEDFDPVARLLPHCGGGWSWPERRLQAEATRYLQTLGARDDLFASLFWQAQRLRCIYYRYVVQRPLTPGLQWFVRHYARLRTGREAMSPTLQIRSAAEQAGVDHGLRSLEIRTAPQSKAEHLAFIKVLAGGAREVWARSADRCEFGVVLHLAKDRGGGSRRGLLRPGWCDSHADPASDYNAITRYRYFRYYRLKHVEAAIACWGLRAHPETTALIRGLDVCSDELGVPNWVLLPLIRKIRSVAEEEARRVWRPASVGPPRMFTTAHVGEDFIHLLTGLRNVDLAVRYFPLLEGDRIGHGMALGVAATDWCARTGRLMMPLEERLIDLVWAWSYLARPGVTIPAAHRIEREIHALATALFADSMDGVTPSADELARLIGDLHNPNALSLVGYPYLHRRFPKGFRRLVLLHTYLTSAAIFRAGRTSVSVDAAGDADLVEHLQRRIRLELGQRGIAVEINPSSNLMIGDLGGLTQHPFWHLNPPQPRDDAPPVPVCIGSDDPAIFATSTREEYQLVDDAVVAAGLPIDQAREWLDRIRRTGLEYRFTLPVGIARELIRRM